MRRPVSPQEQLLHALSKFSLGASFLFCPDLYGNDEPCDVAWVCDDIAILIWCTTIKRSYAKANAHNLDQARVWLHRWHRGQNLKGRNEGREFDLAYRDCSSIICLSVVDVPGAVAEIHSELGRKRSFGVPAYFATLPQSALHMLANLGGGPRDLLMLIKWVADWSQPMAEDLLNSALAMHANVAMRSLQLEPGLVGSAQFQHWMQVFRNGRNSGDQLRLLEVSFRDALWVATAITNAIKLLAKPGETGPIVIGADKPAPPFPIQIRCCANSSVLVDVIAETVKEPAPEEKMHFFTFSEPIGDGGLVTMPPKSDLPHCRAAIKDLATAIERNWRGG